MSYATLEGHTVTLCEIHLPAWGIWWADIEIGEPEDLSGAVEILISGLTLSGTIMSGGIWQGRARYRVSGGSGGWGTPIASRGYANDAGVKLSRVLLDAASDCGETLDSSTITGTVGPHLVREDGPAARLLTALVPRAWYVGEDGITHLGARDSATWELEHTIVREDISESRIEIASDDLTGLVPGAVVDDIEAVDVIHRVEKQILRSTIYGARGVSGSSRVSTALARAVDALTTHLRYRGVWSYRVVSQTGERLDMQSERVSSGMPDLIRVRVRPGVPGARAEWTPGSMALVSFIDGDPGRPVVVGADDAESPGFLPIDLNITATGDVNLGDDAGDVTVGDGATSVELGTAPRLGVARLTDTVICGGFGGSITLASTTVKAGA